MCNRKALNSKQRQCESGNAGIRYKARPVMFSVVALLSTVISVSGCAHLDGALDEACPSGNDLCRMGMIATAFALVAISFVPMINSLGRTEPPTASEGVTSVEDGTAVVKEDKPEILHTDNSKQTRLQRQLEELRRQALALDAEDHWESKTMAMAEQSAAKARKLSDLKKEIKRLAKEGQKIKLAETLLLIELIEQNRLIVEPGGKLSSRPLHPPRPPDFYVNDHKFPNQLREILHVRNMELAKDYAEGYRNYIDRYLDVLKWAPDPSTLRRRVGPPVQAQELNEPGVLKGAMWEDWIGSSPDTSNLAAYKALSDRLYAFTGKRKPGSAWIFGQLKGKAKLGPLGVEQGSRIELDSDGRTRAKDSTKLSASEGKVAIKVDATKRLEEGGAAASVGLGPADVKVYTDGGAQVDLRVFGGKQGPSAGVFSKGREGEIEGGLNLGMNLEHSFGQPSVGQSNLGTGIELKLGAGMKTITKQEIEDALSSPGFFPNGATRDLVQQGLTWEKIPSDFRQRLEKMAWTQRDWDEQLQY